MPVVVQKDSLLPFPNRRELPYEFIGPRVCPFSSPRVTLRNHAELEFKGSARVCGHAPCKPELH